MCLKFLPFQGKTKIYVLRNFLGPRYMNLIFSPRFVITNYPDNTFVEKFIIAIFLMVIIGHFSRPRNFGKITRALYP